MTIVFFVYGLAFFSMGIMLSVYPTRDSKVLLAGKLALIAAFGLLHGINEWVEMFCLLYKPAQDLCLLQFGNLLLLSLSFLCLIIFGVWTITDTLKKLGLLKLLPALLYAAWLVLALTAEEFSGAVVWARYLLAIPGICLTAYALKLQAPAFRAMDNPWLARHLKLAVGGFLAYGFFAGIFVVKAGFFPASAVNQEAFLKIVGIPVQIFRAVCAVVISYALFRLLEIFQIEVKEHILGLFVKVNNAYEKLKGLEKIKDSLTQMVVHDLNNPLAVISGNLQLLQMDPGNLSDEQGKTLELVGNEVREMKRMISNLLDVSKMEEGKLRLVYEDIDLEKLLKEITATMVVPASQEKKTINVVLAPGIPVLQADREILKRIVLNLLGNALKFTPEGSTIELAGQFLAVQGEVEVSVKDQGRGIPPEFLTRVFDKFVQVESNQQRTGKGLGLTFCKMAVEAHGGRIWVESAPGRGSTFYFTLPVRPVM